MVDWLMAHVEGLADRRDAKKLGAAMLHAALIRHTVNKTSFSEQCYYVFCEQVIAAAGAPRLFSIVLSVRPSPFTLHPSLHSNANLWLYEWQVCRTCILVHTLGTRTAKVLLDMYEYFTCGTHTRQQSEYCIPVYNVQL